MQVVANEKNITLYLNNRAMEVAMNGSMIHSVTIQHIESGV